MNLWKETKLTSAENTHGSTMHKMNKEKNETEADRECGRSCPDCPIKNDNDNM
jgi:hypothetical protein